ncbi:MAG: alkaline phosphatase family protein [Pseudomonadota bacterium]|nr:alkaline phosphatase family protein [Pseudomonadota bacterium]
MLLALTLACTPAPAGKVVVLGLDGLEYTMLDRLIGAGELPNFARLMEEGVRGEMEVTTPIMSPILWTTIASGYPADVHGIGGWTTGHGHSFSGADVRVNRIWDVASGAGAHVVVSGWLMTWPATPLNGFMLSERFVWSYPMNKDPAEKSVGLESAVDRVATTSPDALAARAEALRPDDAWIATSPLAYQVRQYGAPFHPLIRDETHVRVFESLWPEADARFGAVYLNGADQVSHMYWSYSDRGVQEMIRKDPAAHAAAAQAGSKPGRRLAPYADGIDMDELVEAGRYVPDYYRYLDTVVGRVRALVGADTTLVVLSDHGFRVSSAQPLTNGSHNDTAVFLAAGRAVKPGRIKLHVFDVAPTLYALLGLPAAADMPGKVLTDAFDVTPVPTVPSHRLPRVAVEAGASGGGLADDQLRDQLEALGYIDAEGLPDASIGQSRKLR